MPRKKGSKRRARKRSRREYREKDGGDEDDPLFWKKTLFVVVVLALVVSGVVAIGYVIRLQDDESVIDNSGPGEGSHPPPDAPVVPDADQVFDFALTDVDGQDFTLSKQTEKLVLVDLMATWCGPCGSQLPEIEDAVEEIGGSSLQVVSVDVDLKEDNAKLSGYRDDHKITWPVARDTAGLGERYNVQSIPTLLLFDQKGNLLKTWVGVTLSGSIISECEKHL